MVASLLTWQIYNYSTWTNNWHHFFPPVLKVKWEFKSNKPILNQIYENYETCYTKGPYWLQFSHFPLFGLDFRWNSKLDISLGFNCIFNGMSIKRVNSPCLMNQIWWFGKIVKIKTKILFSGEARNILLGQSRLVQFYQELYTHPSIQI